MTRVLIVEDEAIIAEDLRQSLSSLGYRVCDVVSSGRAALDSLERTAPDVILMDVRLQGDLDGIETARRALETHDVAVVFLTSHSDEATLARAKATMPHGYLLKPFTDRDLRTTIEVAAVHLERRGHKRSNFVSELDATMCHLIDALRALGEMRGELAAAGRDGATRDLQQMVEAAVAAVEAAVDAVETAADVARCGDGPATRGRTGGKR